MAVTGCNHGSHPAFIAQQAAGVDLGAEFAALAGDAADWAAASFAPAAELWLD